MRSALLLIAGIRALTGCVAPGNQHVHDARSAPADTARPEAARRGRSADDAESVGASRSALSARPAPADRPEPADRPRIPPRSGPPAEASAQAQASPGGDCKALEPEVQKASRMIEVLRQSDINTPPEALRRVADRLDLWASEAEVHLSDPELAQAAKDIRESFSRTSAAVRRLQATLDARDTRKAGRERAGLEQELDRNAKVVRQLVGRCKSNPYAPFEGKGYISPSVVRRVVEQNFDRMRACYEERLRKDPSIGGRLPVHLVVDGDGKVTYAGDADRPPRDAPLLIALPSLGASQPSSDAPPLDDPSVVRCVLGVFRGLKFPPPTHNRVATVLYPIVFGVQDKPAPAAAPSAAAAPSDPKAPQANTRARPVNAAPAK